MAVQTKTRHRAEDSQESNRSAEQRPFKLQLLKWIGNKQRFAAEIISHFPREFGAYHEPFLGSGAVLGSLAPERAFASDVFAPLVEIWRTLRDDPQQLKVWYRDRLEQTQQQGKVAAYDAIKASYNAQPNAADLLFLCRACYGGVVRFRKKDGHMSTPCGAHEPISPANFAHRVDVWHERTHGAEFSVMDFEAAMRRTEPGDLVYCDPPYQHSQQILYGAQAFSLERLFDSIASCKQRGVYIALSIDGSKRSGTLACELPIPNGLFAREATVNCGRSMLRRFQMEGQSLAREVVADRLLLTY